MCNGETGRAGNAHVDLHLRYVARGKPEGGLGTTREGKDSQTNHPSSSSRRVLAGRGAPAPSVVGSCTYPRSPKGFNDCIEDSNPERCDVLAVVYSRSRRDQPSEFIDSLKDADAIV